MHRAYQRVLMTMVLAASTPVAAATPECEARTAEMRDELERTSKQAAGSIEVPSMLADWARDLVRRFDAEKDASKRAMLIGEAWPKAFSGCKEPFARAFADAAAMEPAAKVKHLKRAIPDAFLACGCEGADPDAIEVLMAMASRDLLRDARADQRKRNVEVARAAGVKKLAEVIRKKGSLYRIVRQEKTLQCGRWRFRPGRSALKGLLDGPVPMKYEYWLDGTLELTDTYFSCFFRLSVASSRPDALLLAGYKVAEAMYLTPAACDAALAATPAPEPVKHDCGW